MTYIIVGVLYIREKRKVFNRDKSISCLQLKRIIILDK